jgi:ferredoxin
MEIEVDQETCIGAGQCVMAAPEVFDQREEDGIVELLDAAPGEAQWPAVREAAAICPASAIAVREG